MKRFIFWNLRSSRKCRPGSSSGGREHLDAIPFRTLGVKASCDGGRSGLGLFGRALSAGSSIGSGGFASGTFRGTRSIFLRLLFFFLLLFLRSFFRLPRVSDGSAEYHSEIFLRQSVELEMKC
jgi:hypothetical protein